MDDLDLIIEELISRKVEGPYWDFKVKWYSNDDKGKGSLLHDILCMANNLEDRDAYIIIGVENKSCKIQGVQEDPNRRSTADLCCFLKDKDFGGEIRPSVRVETLRGLEKEVDVIIIEKSNNTPFFVTKDYFCIVKANSIYTRIGDTNTPKDSTADIDKIEYLWKKRFGINKSPIQKLPLLLEQEKSWKESHIKDIEYDVLFHDLYPEYTIRTQSTGQNSHKLYMLNFIDNTPHWGRIEIYYHQTLIKAFSSVGLDGYRYLIVAPKREVIKIKADKSYEEIPLFYFFKNSLEFLISKVLCNEYGYNDFYRKSNFGILELSKSVFLFKDESEKLSFKDYLENHKTEYLKELKKIKADNKIYLYSENIEPNVLERFKQQMIRVEALKDIYADFNLENNKQSKNHNEESRWGCDKICFPQ